MNENMKATCDLILSNRDVFKKSMRWELDSNTYAIMAGVLTASKGMTAEPELYKECKQIIKRNVSMLSEIRGLSEAVIAVKMMIATDKEGYIQGVQEVYKKLRSRHKLTASPYMVMAAMNLYESKGPTGADEGIEQLEALYKGLHAKHPLLISDSDRGYLSMLVGLNVNIEKALDDIERNYETCKGISFSKNTAYSLAQVLALSDRSVDENYVFVKAVLDGLKENKKAISKEYGLTLIGALSLLGIRPEQLVRDIAEIDDYIKGKPGFKWFNESKGLRVTYAALAVFLSYSQDGGMQDTLSANIAITIAEEVLLLLIVLICTSTSASTSSSH